MKKIILENQIGVLIEKGKFVRELTPGEVSYSPVWKKQQVQVFDIRPVYATVGENYMTRDQLSVALSVSLSYSIVSPLAYLRAVSDAYNLIRATVGDETRTWASKLTLDELLEKHGELKAVLEKRAASGLQKYGLKLESLSPPVVTLPRGLKQAVEAKLVASKKSEADMEEARGRTAVLRHYANAARMVKDEPELLKLLLGQKAKSLQVQFSDSVTPSAKR